MNIELGLIWMRQRYFEIHKKDAFSTNRAVNILEENIIHRSHSSVNTTKYWIYDTKPGCSEESNTVLH